MEPVFFSKVVLSSRIGAGFCYPENTIMIDIPKKEISFQKCKWIERSGSVEVMDDYGWDSGLVGHDVHYLKPAVKIKNGKTGFEYKVLPVEKYEQKIIKSIGLSLSDYEIDRILPFCNALEFELYRDMGDDWEHMTGYFDEVSIHFQAVTDSYIPMLEMSCNLSHEKGYERPQEKLRDFILEYMSKNKKFKGVSLLDFGN